MQCQICILDIEFIYFYPLENTEFVYLDTLSVARLSMNNILYLGYSIYVIALIVRVIVTVELSDFVGVFKWLLLLGLHCL